MKKRILLLLAAVLCVSLCACGGSETTNGDNENTQKEESGGFFKTEKEIEITMDNWQEYYEFKFDVDRDSINVNKNAFDEVESINILYGTYLCLKEEYIDKFVSSDIAIEIKANEGDIKMARYNLSDESYEIVSCEERIDERLEKTLVSLGSPFLTFPNDTAITELKSNKVLVWSGTNSTIDSAIKTYLQEEEIIKGDIVETYVQVMLNSEVIRIQGTLVIAE